MSNPIHITAIAPYRVFPADTGGKKNIEYFFGYLSKRVPLTVISTGNNDTASWKNIEFLKILGNSSLRYINPFLFFRVRKILRDRQSTHLLIEHPYYGWLAVLLKWFCNVQLIVHSHNIESTRFKSINKWWWGILWHYEKFTHRMAGFNFFITEEDRQFAISKYKLSPQKCHVITYGIDLEKPPSPDEKAVAKKILQQTYHFDPACMILLFSGALNYQPNIDAVEVIIDRINPLLLAEKGFQYKIIICGKDLPARFTTLNEQAGRNIVFAGFVDDITVYYKGADLFINPVNDGGGIKTKLVEALGYNLYSISTPKGAFGVPVGLTGQRMTIAGGKDWKDFAAAIVKSNPVSGGTGKPFYEHFYWENIAAKAAGIIESGNQ